FKATGSLSLAPALFSATRAERDRNEGEEGTPPMPDPISSSRPLYDTCDPNTACCNDPLPEAAQSVAQPVAPIGAPAPAIVSVEACLAEPSLESCARLYPATSRSAWS